MGFMAEYLNHHLQLDLEALRHGHPQLRHLSTALVTACRALHRRVAWERRRWKCWGHPPTPSPRPLHGGRASPPRLGRCRCQLSPARLLRSEIDFTLAGLETLARVFDSPASPRSPAREQVSPLPSTVAARSRLQVLCHAWVGAAGLQGRWGGRFGCLSAPKGGRGSCFSCQTPGTPITRGAAWIRREEFAGPVPPPCSKNVPPSPQGLLTSDPDLELLLNKISTVNHLLSSLEKKVPAPPTHRDARLGKPSWVQGEARPPLMAPTAQLCQCPELGNLTLLQQTPHLN